MPFKIENGVLIKHIYDGVQNIGIPKNVTIIGKDAFRGDSFITSIIIPDGVKEIGNFAFAYCTSLKNLIIPDSVTSVGDRAFIGCLELKSISIPKHLRKIDANHNFYGIFGTQEIIIRNSETPVEKATTKTAEKTPPKKTTKKTTTQKAKPATPPPPAPKPTEPEEVCEKTELEMIFEYFKMSEDKDARIYIQNHLAEFMQFLIDKQNVERITEITEHTDFLTADNIDEFLKYSIQNSENGGSFKIQLILTNYKAKLLNL
ncbi:MAG TPA: hypothetical protein DCO72_01830 [Ruminococcus sp.]|nr:hypothetical protein [Ruminococcus sp.]